MLTIFPICTSHIHVLANTALCFKSFGNESIAEEIHLTCASFGVLLSRPEHQ